MLYPKKRPPNKPLKDLDFFDWLRISVVVSLIVLGLVSSMGN